jgi:hypothetical protein
MAVNGQLALTEIFRSKGGVFLTHICNCVRWWMPRGFPGDV